MKKEIANVIGFVGVIVMIVGLLFGGGNVAVVALQTMVFWGGLAVCFVFAKNEVVKNIGYFMCIFTGVKGVSCFSDSSDAVVIIAIGAIILAICAILYYIRVALEFFGFAKVNAHGINDASVVSSLTKLKEMQDENVISEDEYTVLKSNFLESLSTSKLTIDDLKKWKKLLDQKIITEEEFANMKAKVFGK